MLRGNRKDSLSPGPSPNQSPKKVSEKQPIGAPRLPVAAGIVAAGLGAGYLAKKASQTVFNKQAENRLKKEQPVEYLKHKYGSFQSASEALGQPSVSSWQELTPYMNQ